MNWKKEEIGLLFLRLGLGGVFLWFGIDKFINPDVWSSLIPISGSAFLNVLGIVEILVGVLVLIGLFTRVFASVAALMLVGIIISIWTSFGFDYSIVRDGGLLFLALGIAFIGPGANSVDWKMGIF